MPLQNKVEEELKRINQGIRQVESPYQELKIKPLIAPKPLLPRYPSLDKEKSSPPPEPTIPPQTSVGPLECGDREVIREQVPADGSDFVTFSLAGETLIRGLEGVDTIEQEDPTSLVWYGYDEAGKAIVVVSFEDISPEMFSIFTCP